jgi:hypothetical protein
MTIFKRPVSVLLFLAAVAMAPLLASCSNDSPINCPQEGLGSLQGFVRSSGHGVAAEVSAVLQEDEYYETRQFETVSDTTGWYRLDLPPGVYHIEVRPHGNASYFHDSRKTPDTIRVTPRVIPFHLERCRAEVTVHMPEEFDGLFFSMELEVEEGSVKTGARQEDGVLEFKFPVLLPGFYTMALDHTVLGNPVFLDRPTSSGGASHLWVDAEGVARFTMDYRSDYASISGTASGGCIANGARPRIRAFNADSVVVASSYGESGGTFELITLVPEAVRVLASYGDVDRWVGGDSYATARRFELAKGDRIEDVDLTWSGFRVFLNGPGHYTAHQPQVTVLDDTGRTVLEDWHYGNPFTVCNLEAGRYFLKVDGYCEQQAWAPQWYGGGAVREDAVPIDLAAGNFPDLNLDLVTGARISGVIRQADGPPANIRDLGLYSDTGEPLCDDWRNWRNFEDGRFEYPGLGDGRYYLGTHAWNREGIWWYPGTYDFAMAEALVIENGADVSGLDWSLPPEGGSGHE